ncbi:hypothetical protein [Methylophilus sp. 3sh_L]|uniref:hypothetical protein n=1 Tax=Methylophilus sp. 3sh_L TaxID=3377114 RepID=UPI00398F805E
MMMWFFIFTILLCFLPSYKPEILTANPDHPITKKQWIISWVSLYVIVLVVSASWEQPQKKDLPDGSIEDRVKFLSSNIESVRDFGEVLEITHYSKDAFTGKSWVINFASDAQKIISRLDEITHGKKYNTLAFMVKLSTVDNLGHEGSQTGMKVFYDMDLFKNAVFENMSMYNFLELPREISFSRLGRENAKDYCESNSDVNRLFCGKLSQPL